MVNCGKGRQERWPGGFFSFLEISKVLRENLIHPQSLTWNLKIGPGKGDSYWKPSFSGSMFNFRGVPIVRSYIKTLKTQYWIRGALNSTVLYPIKDGMSLPPNMKHWLVVSSMFYFHPYLGKMISF